MAAIARHCSRHRRFVFAAQLGRLSMRKIKAVAAFILATVAATAEHDSHDIRQEY